MQQLALVLPQRNINKPPQHSINCSGKISKLDHLSPHRTHEFLECPNTSRISYLINMDTGKTLPIACNRYDCPVCGPKKLYRLRNAIYIYLKGWEHVRMMTLSISTQIGENAEENYKILQECWRRFITELRRTKTLRADQRRFQYIRVPEMFASGYHHMHLLISHFLLQKDLFKIWRHICYEVTKNVLVGGSVNVKDLPGAANGAYYVTKYVTKLITEASFIIRRYSKSGEIVLFVKTSPKGCWRFILGSLPPIADQIYDEVMTFFTCHNTGISSQGTEAENDSDPPF